MRARVLPLIIAAGLVAAWAGCTPRPRPDLVDARNFGAFYYWRSMHSRQFTPERWREFNDAVQELRLQAMGRGVTGTDAIDEALCGAINGHKIDEILRLGDEAKLERLRPLRDRLKTIVDVNALLAARPGDEDLAASLADRLQDQQRRLAQLTAEIEQARRSLLAHGGTTGDNSPDQKPAVLSRTDALREFDTLIETRLRNAALHYGDWPARFDREGTTLPEEDRRAFLDRVATAKTNGHTVIAVYVRASWWIYDQAVSQPEFSAAVTGNLTPTDRRDWAEMWENSEAEIWARKQASKQSAETAIANIRDDVRRIMK